MRNIYDKLYQDFIFLENFGYKFAKKILHYSEPSIVFENDISAMRVGMDSITKRIYAVFYDHKNLPWEGSLYVLENIKFDSRSYKKQVETAKRVLNVFLENKANNK